MCLVGGGAKALGLCVHCPMERWNVNDGSARQSDKTIPGVVLPMGYHQYESAVSAHILKLDKEL